ncbi:MAG: OmpA/MotB family protein [Nitrospiraceae bacterium]
MTRPIMVLLSALLGASFWPTGATSADLAPSGSLPREVRWGESAIAFSAGFIRDSLPVDGYVTRTVGAQYTGDKVMLGVGDSVFLRLTKKAQEPAPGDLYTIYRFLHKVYHPLRGRHLGNLFAILGIVRVTKVDEDLASVFIERSFDSIAPGDRVMRFALPPREEPPSPGRTLPDTPGTIVDLQDRRTLIGQRNVVYIDWGREEYLAIGDRLDVYRVMAGLPHRSVGELKVIALEDHTATAMITRSTTPFLRADRFTFKGAGKGIASPEEPRTVSLTPEPVAQPPEPPAPGAESQSPGSDQVDMPKLKGLLSQLQYESGEAAVTPAQGEILMQVSNLLRDVKDAEILVEGHADDMPIGPSLKQTFPSNQELSDARANNAVRYMVEEGGLDPASLSAAGYSDSQPIASNATETGKSKNRRIEITFQPKERSELAPEPSIGQTAGDAGQTLSPAEQSAPLR